MSNFEKIRKMPLTIPPDFVPYMEKHRLYEFFYELVTQLLIQQPEDPVVFMKQSIQHVLRKRDIPTIILIAPPSFDKMTVANILQKEIGVRPVTLKDLHALSAIEDTCQCYDANEIAERMKKMLMSGVLHESGWILVDIPRNKKEARALQRVGVLPTHVIQIISSNENETRKEMAMSDQASRKCSEDVKQRDYKKVLRGLREAYADLLIEVDASNKTIRELGMDCVELTKIRRHCGAPSLFRIVLVGPPGSGCRSLADHISKRFNLVNIDFNRILKQACSQETALGEIFRLGEHRYGRNLITKIQIEIVEKYVLRSECLQKGWILTGYPLTVEDFKLLDMISTPPNRVFILDVDIQTCKQRLLGQYKLCNNVATDSEHNLVASDYSRTTINHESEFDSKDIVERNLRDYEENIKSIMRYVGQTASVIDARCERKLVREKAETYLMRPAPVAKLRIARSPPTIDPMDVEFDPDDEPDPSVFDDIRAPEPKFSFI